MTDQVPIPSAPAVVVNDDAPTLAQPAKAPMPKTGPKWEMEAKERVKAAIKKFSKPLSDLVARDANEGDTRLLGRERSTGLLSQCLRRRLSTGRR